MSDRPGKEEPAAEPDSEPPPWFAKPSRRLPVLLAILGLTLWFAVPKLVHNLNGTASSAALRATCDVRVESEPRSHRMDQMFVISDSDSSGTWARTDPCDGIWYRRGHRPREGGRWILNGTNVDIDCARKAALYAGRFKGQSQTWSTWLHARAGFWIPSLISQPWRRDSFSGLPRC